MDVHEFSVECVTRAPNAYTAVIAVNDDVGDGLPLSLRTLDLEPYKRNPVVMFSHGIGGGMLNAPDSMPVGRSTDIRFDERGRLLADFEFLPGDAFASRVKNAWDRGFLRAASVRATPARRKSGAQIRARAARVVDRPDPEGRRRRAVDPARAGRGHSQTTTPRRRPT